MQRIHSGNPNARLLVCKTALVAVAVVTLLLLRAASPCATAAAAAAAAAVRAERNGFISCFPLVGLLFSGRDEAGFWEGTGAER